jgi:hypothetical protein
MTLEPTPLPELNAVLHELVTGVHGILGSRLLAAYLQGSFALGDWDMHSDVDFLFVLDGELQADELEALQGLHQRIHALPSTWAQHLEGSYIPKDVLASGDTGTSLWYLDNGNRTLELSTHCNTLVVRRTTREHGITLYGAEPKTLIPPVSDEALRLEVRAVLRDWGTEILERPTADWTRWYQQFVVSSHCRMLHTLATGEVTSKRVAALWAEQHLEPQFRALIQTAWTEHAIQRENYRRNANPEDAEQTLAFVSHTLEMATGLQRLAELKAGAVQGVPGEEALRKAKQALE